MEAIVVLILGSLAIFVAVNVIKFALISTVQFIRVSFTLCLIVIFTQVVTLGVFEPFYSQFLPNRILTGSDVISNFIFLGVFTSIVALIFGRSLPFRLYGILAVIINISVIFFVMLIVFGTDGYEVLNVSLTNASEIDSFTVFSIYLNSLNISTFFLYGYDKFRAWIFPKSTIEYGVISPPPVDHWSQKLARWFETFAPWIKPPRVPEWILHWHSIFGGSIGAFFGQRFFRHKTKSKKFRPVFLKTVVVQILLLILIAVANSGAY